jgi:tRNA-uridine 2-sulfurtransferase
VTVSPTVVVAMSGGVDSSVAAALLKQIGFEVIGAHIICWDDCGLKEERRDALRVALQLEIPFFTFDFRDEYREQVFDYMIREYAEGKTPNPDVLCNREIKFGLFLDKALELDANYIATGHYAKLAERGQEPGLWEADDKAKDQSYFLWDVNRDRLRRVIFPLQQVTKAQVREIARRLRLPTAEKKDSQGLCFIGPLDFGYFLREHLPCQEGAVVNSRGRVVGRHDGVPFYTIGQRHGLGIGAQAAYYVAEKNIATNTLIVGVGADDPILFKKEILVGCLNWLSNFRAGRCEARIRYRQPKILAQVTVHGDQARVIFDSPQRGVAPGQSAVFYDRERVLGGGVIL